MMNKPKKTAILVLMLAFFVLGVVASVHASSDDKCSDHKDNDHDGYRDGDDPDCKHGGTEGDKHHDQCNDERDNEGDGSHDGDDKECKDHPEKHDEEGDNHDKDGGVCQEGPGKNEYKAAFDYVLGGGAQTFIFKQDPISGGQDGGTVEVSDDGTYLYFKISVYPGVKPWLAWGEKVDKNKDGVVDLDKNGIPYTRLNLRSDGVFPLDLYDGSNNLLITYNWKVYPTSEQDPEFTVPSYTDSGMLTGPIVYNAKIPIPPGFGGHVTMSVHISPHDCPLRQEIPEFPNVVLPVLVGLGGYFALRRRKK